MSKSALTRVAALTPITTIRPPSRWSKVDFHEIWEHREVLYFFIWRDLKVRYKRTVIGAAWAVIQPLLAMVVFSIFFGRLAGMPSEGAPYPIFAYAALLPWMYFANALVGSTNSAVQNERILSKVYFPRIFLPVAPVITGLVDLGLALVILIAMMLFYGVKLTLAVITLPLFLLMAVATAFAFGLWFAALNVLYQDIRYAVPFLVQFWLFASPVVYPSSLVPERWHFLYGLNPMAGVIDGFRWALLGVGDPPGILVAFSAGMVFLVLTGGLVYFRRVEDFFADLV